jgi:Tol biopolymer transport system component
MLTPGTKLGPYEIVAPIGAGGMGEVLRARDTRIGRDVAIKLLPADFAKDPERLRRFEIEARAAGSLNHPNLVTIHEFGVHGTTPYLVMELLEGETLRDKLGDTSLEASRARLPIRKALDLSQQLANGLAAAHQKGIIHRDLKPENVFVTEDGRLKILDFGLAKLVDGAGGNASESDVTRARGNTSPGSIMGTVGYMSPEQVRGQEVDHRTDIFACGAILYEMLSGHRAFHGMSSADAMSAILHEDPRELSSDNGQQVPPGIDRVVRRCLEKEKAQRFESAHDLAFALDAVGVSSSSHANYMASDPPHAGKQLLMGAIFAAVALIAAVTGVVAYRSGRSAAMPQTVTARQLTFAAGVEATPSIAPDGKTFVFVKGAPPHRQLFLQRVDGQTAIALSRSADDDDYQPAFSPDGSQIAFRSERDGGGIFVMGATGESVRRVTTNGFDPTWSPDGRQIAFASEAAIEPTSRNSVSALSIVDLSSAAVRQFPAAGDVMQPVFSPHGKRIAFWGLPITAGGQRDLSTVAVNGDAASVVLATNDAALDWNPVWAPDGKSLIFSSDRGGTVNLWRLPIDEESGKPTGPPEPIAVPAMWAGRLSISSDGRHLLYVSRTRTEEIRRGTFDPVTEKMTIDATPVLSGSTVTRNRAISPDGKWITFSTDARQEDVFIMRADGSDLRQLTNDIARDRGCSWTPDSSRVVFYSARTGKYDAWSIRVDGSGLTQLTSGAQVNFPLVSPDGRRLAFFDLQTARVATIGDKPATTFETLPPLPGREQFFPTSWSHDGTKLFGTVWRINDGVWIYSFADKTYRHITMTEEAIPPDPATAVGRTAQIDDHRLIATTGGNHVVVADIVTGAVRPIGLAGASFTPDGKMFLTGTTHTEEDVWLATLGDGK